MQEISSTQQRARFIQVNALFLETSHTTASVSDPSSALGALGGGLGERWEGPHHTLTTETGRQG